MDNEYKRLRIKREALLSSELGLFISAKDLGYADEVYVPGRLHQGDMILRETNYFIYFDKKRRPGEGWYRREDPFRLITYWGRFNPASGEIIASEVEPPEIMI